MKSPLSLVKDTFGDKSKLVAAVEKFTGEDLWIGRTNTNKGLAHVSNAKLLRLHATFTTVKEKFGTRAKLIDAICDLEKRAKDAGYKTRISAYPVPRLWDMLRSIEKRAKREKSPASAGKKPVEKKPAAPKKAAAKATGASKGAKA